MAMRLWDLLGGYHCETIQMAPGKKPAVMRRQYDSCDDSR